MIATKNRRRTICQCDPPCEISMDLKLCSLYLTTSWEGEITRVHSSVLLTSRGLGDELLWERKGSREGRVGAELGGRDAGGWAWTRGGERVDAGDEVATGVPRCSSVGRGRKDRHNMPLYWVRASYHCVRSFPSIKTLTFGTDFDRRCLFPRIILKVLSPCPNKNQHPTIDYWLKLPTPIWHVHVGKLCSCWHFFKINKLCIFLFFIWLYIDSTMIQPLTI